MFWCFPYWNPNRITSKLLSFILKVWGNHGRRETVRHVHLFVFTGDQARISAREFMCLSEYVCVCVYVRYRVCVAATLSSLCQTALTWWRVLKWHQSGPPPHFHPFPVVPYSLSSTSKPTHPSTYNQKKIKWFIISSRLQRKVKTWKIKDKKGLSETLVQFIFRSPLFPLFPLFLTE